MKKFSRKSFWLANKILGFGQIALLLGILVPGLKAESPIYTRCLRFNNPDSTLSCLLTHFPHHTGNSGLIRRIADVIIQSISPERGKAVGRNFVSEFPENPAGYYLLARVAASEGQYKEAVQWMQRAIDIDPAFEPAFGPTGGLPDIYRDAALVREGKKYFEQLLEQNPGSALAAYGLGQMYFHEYDWNSSRRYNELALKRNPLLISPYFALFTINRMQMKYYEALLIGEKLFDVAKKKDDFETMAYAKSKMGHINFFFGNYRKAMALYHEALVFAREVADLANTGKILNDLGAIYAFLGDLDKGMSYFKAALQILEQTGQVKRQIMTLYNIGLANKDNGYPNIARQYFQEAIRLAKAEHFESLLRLPYTGLAEVYLENAEVSTAHKYFSEALKICQEVGDAPQQGYILRNMGSLYERQNQADKALEYYQKALELSVATGDLQLIWESYAGIGNVYFQKEMPDSAIHNYRKAVAIFNKIRQDLDLQQLNTSFLYDKFEIYPKLLQLLAQNGEIEEAFQIAEQYKAQALLSILTRGQFLLSELLPDSIATQYKVLKFRISALRDQIAREQAQAEPDTNWIVARDQEVAAAEMELSHILEKVKKEYKQFAQLTVYREKSLKELQKNLSEGEVALEYVLGDEKIFCFVVGREWFDYIEIPQGRKQLIALLGELSPLFRLENSPVFNFLTPELADFKIKPAFQLYQELIKPVESRLNGARQIRIIPDDILNYLPFELLVYDTSGIRHQYDFPSAKFLIEKYSFSYEISLSSLGFFVNTRNNQAPNGVLAMGDPETGKEAVWTPLPAAKKEIHQLKRIIKGKNDLWLTGARVSKKRYLEEADQYRLLHFATHFQNNFSNPLYSGLVMSGNDSLAYQLLQTYEIFEKPINADLVVLSACNTALGKFARGEGLIGITRAFAYAGAPAQVVSLWSVSDESSAKLIGYFYENLLKGHKKDIALQLAKLRLFEEDPAMKDPYYWAPLVIRGDIRPLPDVDDLKKSNGFLTSALLAFLLVALGGALLKWGRSYLNH